MVAAIICKLHFHKSCSFDGIPANIFTKCPLELTLFSPSSTIYGLPLIAFHIAGNPLLYFLFKNYVESSDPSNYQPINIQPRFWHSTMLFNQFLIGLYWIKCSICCLDSRFTRSWLTTFRVRIYYIFIRLQFVYALNIISCLVFLF